MPAPTLGNLSEDQDEMANDGMIGIGRAYVQSSEICMKNTGRRLPLPRLIP